MEINGRGCIRQCEKDKPKSKCRRWLLRVSIGMNPATGKYCERTKSFHGTYRQAQAALDAFREELRGQEPAYGRRLMTFEELAREWIDHRVALKQVSEKTLASLKTAVTALNMHLAKVRIDKLTPAMIEAATSKLMAGDSPSGKPVTAASLGTYLSKGHLMYSYALKRGYVANNPFDRIDHPRKEKKERPALNATQRNKVLEAMSPDNPSHAAIMLAMLAGLRISETVNLRWSDVDLRDKTLRIRGSKTAASNATVPIRESLADWLSRFKAWQEQGAYEAGYSLSENRPVTSNSRGAGVSMAVVRGYWNKHRPDYGCEGITFHSLRHTFATELAESKLHPSIVQKLMRHASPDMALDTYIHINIDAMRESLNGLN